MQDKKTGHERPQEVFSMASSGNAQGTQERRETPECREGLGRGAVAFS